MPKWIGLLYIEDRPAEGESPLERQEVRELLERAKSTIDEEYVDVTVTDLEEIEEDGEHELQWVKKKE